MTYATDLRAGQGVLSDSYPSPEHKLKVQAVIQMVVESHPQGYNTHAGSGTCHMSSHFGLTDVVLSADFLEDVDLLLCCISDLLDLLWRHLVWGSDVDDLHCILLRCPLVNTASHHAAHSPEEGKAQQHCYLQLPSGQKLEGSQRTAGLCLLWLCQIIFMLIQHTRLKLWLFILWNLCSLSAG